uniref:Ovule protein n=1 Tax=Meloidogyne incognita TaxID=6306 RepID=A0A914M3J7_MELIC
MENRRRIISETPHQCDQNNMKEVKNWKINKQIKTTSTSHQKNIKQQHQKHSLYNNSLRLFLELIVIILLELKELRMKLMIQTNHQHPHQSPKLLEL